jgi:hypothetical protein
METMLDAFTLAAILDGLVCAVLLALAFSREGK